MKKRFLALPMIFIALVTILIVFLPSMFSEVKAPSKEIREDNQHPNAKNPEVDYTISFDEDSYKLVKGGQSDTLTTKTPLEEKYPEVSLKIEQINDQSPEELLPILEK